MLQTRQLIGLSNNKSDSKNIAIEQNYLNVKNITYK